MAKKLFSNLEIPIGEDTYSFDGLTKADLTELDLTKFPTQDELNTFNTHLTTEQYVKKADLTVLNLQAIINRIETIERQLNIITPPPQA